MVTPDITKAMTKARRAGKTLEQVADEFGTSIETVKRHTPPGIKNEKTKGRRKLMSGPPNPRNEPPTNPPSSMEATVLHPRIKRNLDWFTP